MMSRIVGDLRRSAHMFSPELVAFVESDSFAKVMNKADKNDDTKAVLMIEALKGMALDPLAGDTPEAFASCYRKSIVFNISFNRVVNFIGWFDLPADSERADQVLDAIRSNLESPMFKAAAVHRRLDKRRKALHVIADDKAREARQAVFKRYGVNYEKSEIREEADAAYHQIYDPWMAKIDARIKRVADVSAPEFKGAYTEALAQFLYGHLQLNS